MATIDVARRRAPASLLAASLAVTARRLGEVWAEIRRSPTALVGLGILIFFVAIALFAPLLAHYPPLARVSESCNPICPGSPPSSQFPLGTSSRNADIYSEVIWGTQISLFVGILSAIVASVVGTTVGLISGFAGGWIDEVVMRFNDIVLSIPWLVLMIIVAALIGTIDVAGLILVIGLTGWSLTARVIRAQVLSVKERMFVERARMIGSSNLHLLWRHIFPNAFPLIFANTILTVAVSILSESVLAFLGLSTPDHVSWGKIISEAYENHAILNGNALWIVVPGLCIVVLVFGFYLFGYALDEILNPRLRRR